MATKEKKQKPTQVVAVIPPQAQNDVRAVEALISQAVDKGLAVEQMERLLAMRDRVMAERARAAFVQSMADFQANCPVIEKTKKVLNADGKSVRYMYAPMDSIVRQIQKPVADAGLSYRFETVQEKDVQEIKAICHVTHVLGHTESSYFSVPIGDNKFMTSPQAFASALTFAKRYALLNALGISTGDEDTDAVDVKKEATALSPKSKIVFLLRTLKEKTDTAAHMAEAVERFTGLMLVEKNYSAIVAKLEDYVRKNNLDYENQTIR